MNNPKNNTTKSALDFREGVEKGTAQAHDNYEKIGAAATEGAGRVKSGMSTAFKCIQDYNTKLLEFAHANTKSAFDFFQQLSGVKSTTALVELSTEHTRKQFETFAEQTKQLTSLAQSATFAAAEPLKAGVAKALTSSRVC
jgi:phasin